MKPAGDRLFSWILGLGPTARYNLTSSGLTEPDLSAMGVDTSFESFASERDEHARLFAEAIAELYNVEADNVVITSGASEAIFMVYSVLGTGGRALVPLPNYEPMFSVPRSLGMEVRHSLAGGSPPRRTVYGLTDPNNPTGRSLDGAAVRGLIDAAGGRETTVFVNETYKEFTFPGSPSSSFGRDDKVVACSTMTKFYGLGRLRVGWILAEKQKALKLLRAKWLISGHNSEYSLWVARQVLKKRDRFVKRARQVLSENLALTKGFLEETRGISATLGVTPFCLVRYEKGPDSVSFSRRLLKKTGVLVSPGDYFAAPRAFRLCFTADRKTLAPGLRELARFLGS